MKTTAINCEVVTLILLSFIPWPGPTIFKITCSRDRSSLVMRLVQQKWLPVLSKYRVSLPLECPVHPGRDIYGPHEAAKKQHRPSQWTCGFCGKSFYEEKFLDLHFDNRHKDKIHMGEDAVCLADYCDIMRCEVLSTMEEFSAYSSGMNTDIEIWREATAYQTALSKSIPRDLIRVSPQPNEYDDSSASTQTTTVPSLSSQQPSSESTPETEYKKRHCPRDSDSDNENVSSSDNENGTDNTCDDVVDSAHPQLSKAQKKMHELQKLKNDCKNEDLEKIKEKCEMLLWNCIAGLLVNLSVQDFRDVHEELHRAVCWYLTCDRYWDGSTGDQRHFPWALLLGFVFFLSCGICLCYYIIWVLFESDSGIMGCGSAAVTAATTPVHYTNSTPYREEYFEGTEFGENGQSDHYIYVTYPPELKRRLMESCYNRTTRV